MASKGKGEMRGAGISRSGILGLVGVLASVAGVACSPSNPPALTVSPVNQVSTGASLPGKVVWRDLLTHDADAAREFYGALFGWEFVAATGSPVGYWEISREGRPIGGLFAAEPDQLDAPLWLVSFSVHGVEDAVASARDLGGSITVEPTDLPDRGRYAVIEDQQGAFLVLLRSASGDPPDGGALEAGDWLWTELWTTDASAALSFYSELLGYRAEDVAARLEGVEEETYGEAAPAEKAPVVFFAMYRDDRPRAGIQQLPGDARPYWVPYVAVTDVVSTVERAEDLGASVFLPPDAVRNSEASILIDPTGAPFGVQQWPRPQGGE